MPDLFDVIWYAFWLVIASYVVHWAYTEIRKTWWPDPKKIRKKKEKPLKEERRRLKEAKVFHVGSVTTGEDKIVVVKDEDEARRVGAKALRVEEEDVVTSEVYEKAVRK